MKYPEAIKDLTFRRNTKYALVGSDPFLKEMFIETAKKSFPEMSHSFFQPEQEEELYLKIVSEPLFEKNMLIIRDFDDIKKKDFSTYLESTPHMIIAVLSADADVRTRQLTQNLGCFIQVECFPFKEYTDDYPIWILGRMSEEGYTCEEGVDNYIYRSVGPDFFSLNNELKKIFFYKTDNRHITKKDAEQVVSLLAHKSEYDMLESYLKGDIPELMHNLDSYSKTNSNYVGLVLFFLKNMEKMYRMSILLSEKKTDWDISQYLGIPKGYVTNKYAPKVRALGKEKLAKMYDELCNLDVKMRVFKGEKRLLMENYFLFLK